MTSRRTPPGTTLRRLRAAPVDAPPAAAAKAAVLRNLELAVTRRLEGRLTGDHLAVNLGQGSEPAGARPYAAGDDARRIDWNLSARSLGPHVRTTEADHELETWLVADRSASLDFGTAQREKRDVVLAAAAAFGFLTAQPGNRFGLIVTGGDRLQRVPARGGRTHVLAALSTLYDIPRQSTATTSSGREADLAAALRKISRTQRRSGQVVVVSDFLEDSDQTIPPWSQELRRVALRHQVIAVQITDPREFALPAVGMLALVDPETGRRLHVQTNASALRTRYAQAAAERHQHLNRLLQDAGARTLHLSTDRDWLRDTMRFLETDRFAERRRPPRRAGGVA
jgi:uncharacterized protein (DUF58 family)